MVINLASQLVSLRPPPALDFDNGIYPLHLLLSLRLNVLFVGLFDKPPVRLIHKIDFVSVLGIVLQQLYKLFAGGEFRPVDYFLDLFN